MDEYIKREDVLKAIEALPNVCGCSAIDRTDAEVVIMDCPTADVAPKSEGERPMFENTKNILHHLKRQVHDRAVRPHNAGIEPYISLKVVDAIIEKEISHAKGGG